MHDTAYAIYQKFLELYGYTAEKRVVELGSRNVNGTLREALPAQASYIGLDLSAGKNVDAVCAGISIPLPDGYADFVIASSVLEHDPAYWLTIVEMCRITKLGGFIYINAPSNGVVHRHPADCWRFYPDAGTALASWV